MHRPRNRQGGGASQNNKGGGHGRGRGRGGDRTFDSRGFSNVPGINQVIPGGFVSMVLKVDQPTGREVQGVVAEVLTSGNHPRGIKVRLVDGRVGRVQKMVTEEEAKIGSDGLSGLGRNGEHSGDRNTAPRFGGRMRYRDAREEEEMDMPAAGYSLGDFLPMDHPLREEDMAPQLASETSGRLSICPVCGQFEGDEIAVSHHVNSHFD
jgi:uncharacterized repeat protein (TIGR03833 family)